MKKRTQNGVVQDTDDLKREKIKQLFYQTFQGKLIRLAESKKDH